MPVTVAEPKARVRRDLAAVLLTDRTDLHERLLRDSKRRIYTCQSRVWSESFTQPAVRDDIPGTLQLGFYRALINRFCAERGITTEWWVAKRREFGKNGKDLSQDHVILVRSYPEFENYFPNDGVTDEEILEGAAEEMARWMSAPGTDYHQAEMQRKLAREGVAANGVQVATDGDRDGGASQLHLTTGAHVRFQGAVGGDFDFDFIDPTAHLEVENALSGNGIADDNAIFGKYINRIAMLAIREYGVATGLYWFCERFFLQRKYSDVLRMIGASEEQMGVTEFERVKKHMTRNLPMMTEHMKSVLRTDPVMRELCDVLRSEMCGNEDLPRPTPSASYVAAVELASGERRKSLERAKKRMIAAVSNDPSVAHLAAKLEESADDDTIRRFQVASQTNDWPSFKRSLLRRAK